MLDSNLFDISFEPIEHLWDSLLWMQHGLRNLIRHKYHHLLFTNQVICHLLTPAKTQVTVLLQ